MQAATLPPLELPTAPVPDVADGAERLLDERGEWEAFSRPLAGGAEWESYLALQGMYCPGCSLVIEEALRPLPGVRRVDVNGATATARVVWTPATGRPSQWWAALRAAGYGALPASDQLADSRQGTQRMLLWRWLV